MGATSAHSLHVVVLCLASQLLLGCASAAPEVRPEPSVSAPAQAPLASWRDGETRQALVAFVQRVSNPSSADFVQPGERIAVFDNDGTLWAEQPLYFQLLFAVDEVKALAGGHPEWQQQEPFRSVLAGDVTGALAQGSAAISRLVTVPHAGMTHAQYTERASAWLAKARHPTLGRPYTELGYRPMRELLDYLRAHGFKTFIVSGGDVAFMRVFAERIYGVPPQQVVGTRAKSEFVLRGDAPVLIRGSELQFYNNDGNKPVAIDTLMGHRPILAVGNSDGDLAMLQWTAAGLGPSLVAFVHHTDPEREWAYDRDSKVGALNAGLDVAAAKGWLLIDMAKDWLRVW